MADPMYENGYPALHDGANQMSLEGQTRFMVALKIRLFGLLAGAIGGALLLGGDLNAVGGVVAVGGFGAALISEIYVSISKPDRQWYEGRAAAESVKTLAWRYAVAGDSFGISLTNPDLDRQFLARVSEVLNDLGDLDLAAVNNDEQITDVMRSIRNSGFEGRRQSYLTGRIEDQHSWYTRKAAHNRKRKHFWLAAALVAQFLGLVLGALIAADVLRFDALGILAAMAATIAGWSQAKQYSTLATAYGITAQELAGVKSELMLVTAPDWEEFVGQAEEAISREHTLWRASRGLRISSRR